MNNAVVKTNFKFENQKNLYVGKVRDVYNIANEYLVMVVSDRISAFDVVLPEGIPYKAGSFPFAAVGRAVAMVDDDRYEALMAKKATMAKTKFGDAIEPKHVEQIEALTKAG